LQKVLGRLLISAKSERCPRGDFVSSGSRAKIASVRLDEIDFAALERIRRSLQSASIVARREPGAPENHEPIYRCVQRADPSEDLQCVGRTAGVDQSLGECDRSRGVPWIRLHRPPCEIDVSRGASSNRQHGC